MDSKQVHIMDEFHCSITVWLHIIASKEYTIWASVPVTGKRGTYKGVSQNFSNKCRNSISLSSYQVYKIWCKSDKGFKVTLWKAKIEVLMIGVGCGSY